MQRIAWFIDLDGTVMEQGTHRLLPGAREFLKRLIESDKHEIIFTTFRGGGAFPKDHPVYSVDATLIALSKLFNIDIMDAYGEPKKDEKKKVQILFGISSPRIIMNDAGAIGYPVEFNAAQYPNNETLDQLEKDLENAQ